MSKIDYKRNDYRSFIFIIHEDHGLLLLHCTRKKSKPPHWQLPGGHTDDFEFEETAKESDDYCTQMTAASKRGSARELFEETGLDVRSNVERLQPARLRLSQTVDKSGNTMLVNEYKNRMFFFLLVTDDDFPKEGREAFGSSHLKLKLSVEHSGFTFQPDPMIATDMLEHHSGGKVSEALRMSLSLSSLPFSPRCMMTASSTVLVTNEKHNEPGISDTTAESCVEDYTDDNRNNATQILLPPPQKKGSYCCFRC